MGFRGLYHLIIILSIYCLLTTSSISTKHPVTGLYEFSEALKLKTGDFIIDSTNAGQIDTIYFRTIVFNLKDANNMGMGDDVLKTIAQGLKSQYKSPPNYIFQDQGKFYVIGPDAKKFIPDKLEYIWNSYGKRVTEFPYNKWNLRTTYDSIELSDQLSEKLIIFSNKQQSYLDITKILRQYEFSEIEINGKPFLVTADELDELKRLNIQKIDIVKSTDKLISLFQGRYDYNLHKDILIRFAERDKLGGLFSIYTATSRIVYPSPITLIRKSLDVFPPAAVPLTPEDFGLFEINSPEKIKYLETLEGNILSGKIEYQDLDSSLKSELRKYVAYKQSKLSHGKWSSINYLLESDIKKYMTKYSISYDEATKKLRIEHAEKIADEILGNFQETPMETLVREWVFPHIKSHPDIVSAGTLVTSSDASYIKGYNYMLNDINNREFIQLVTDPSKQKRLSDGTILYYTEKGYISFDELFTDILKSQGKEADKGLFLIHESVSSGVRDSIVSLIDRGILDYKEAYEILRKGIITVRPGGDEIFFYFDLREIEKILSKNNNKKIIIKQIKQIPYRYNDFIKKYVPKKYRTTRLLNRYTLELGQEKPVVLTTSFIEVKNKENTGIIIKKLENIEEFGKKIFGRGGTYGERLTENQIHELYRYMNEINKKTEEELRILQHHIGTPYQKGVSYDFLRGSGISESDIYNWQIETQQALDNIETLREIDDLLVNSPLLKYGKNIDHILSVIINNLKNGEYLTDDEIRDILRFINYQKYRETVLDILVESYINSPKKEKFLQIFRDIDNTISNNLYHLFNSKYQLDKLHESMAEQLFPIGSDKISKTRISELLIQYEREKRIIYNRMLDASLDLYKSGIETNNIVEKFYTDSEATARELEKQFISLAGENRDEIISVIKLSEQYRDIKYMETDIEKLRYEIENLYSQGKKDETIKKITKLKSIKSELAEKQNKFVQQLDKLSTNSKSIHITTFSEELRQTLGKTKKTVDKTDRLIHFIETGDNNLNQLIKIKTKDSAFAYGIKSKNTIELYYKGHKNTFKLKTIVEASSLKEGGLFKPRKKLVLQATMGKTLSMDDILDMCKECWTEEETKLLRSSLPASPVEKVKHMDAVMTHIQRKLATNEKFSGIFFKKAGTFSYWKYTSRAPIRLLSEMFAGPATLVLDIDIIADIFFGINIFEKTISVEQPCISPLITIIPGFDENVLETCIKMCEEKGYKPDIVYHGGRWACKGGAGLIGGASDSDMCNLVRIMNKWKDIDENYKRIGDSSAMEKNCLFLVGGSYKLQNVKTPEDCEKLDENLKKSCYHIIEHCLI